MLRGLIEFRDAERNVAAALALLLLILALGKVIFAPDALDHVENVDDQTIERTVKDRVFE